MTGGWYGIGLVIQRNAPGSWLNPRCVGSAGCPAANQAVGPGRSPLAVRGKFGDCRPKFIGASVASLGLFILCGRLRSNSRTPLADRQTCRGQTKLKARIAGWDERGKATCVVGLTVQTCSRRHEAEMKLAHSAFNFPAYICCVQRHFGALGWGGFVRKTQCFLLPLIHPTTEAMTISEQALKALLLRSRYFATLHMHYENAHP